MFSDFLVSVAQKFVSDAEIPTRDIDNSVTIDR